MNYRIINLSILICLFSCTNNVRHNRNNLLNQNIVNPNIYDSLIREKDFKSLKKICYMALAKDTHSTNNYLILMLTSYLKKDQDSINFTMNKVKDISISQLKISKSYNDSIYHLGNLFLAYKFLNDSNSYKNLSLEYSNIISKENSEIFQFIENNNCENIVKIMFLNPEQVYEEDADIKLTK